MHLWFLETSARLHNMAQVKPNFLILGAAKTGTTSIYAYLKQHPEVFIPTKETFHFISDAYRDNHLPYPQQRPAEEIVFDPSEFLSLYQGSDHFRARGEVATGYLYYHEQAIPRIKEMLGDEVKLVAVLRQPVDRTYSGYTFFSRDLHERLGFQEALKAESERTEADWDFMWHYVAHSLYAESVEAYQKAFPNVKLMFFDDLRQNPEAFMKELFQFLGVNPDMELDLEMKNVSGAPKSKAFQALVTQENPIKKLFRPVLRLFFGREVRHRMRSWLKARNVGDKDRLDAQDFNALLPRFEADIQRLEQLSGRDLSSWKAPR